MRRTFLLFIFFFAYNINAQTKAEKIDSLLTMLHNQEQFSGNILIVQNGKEILKKSYGFTNRETGEKLNENTIFELASVSKQFTATGIILLNRQGEISYSDKITKYFPELSFCENVTIKNLLNHSSGIPDYIGLMMEKGDNNKIMVNEDVIEVLSKTVDSLKFKPNDKYEYSNTNYLLLASIIEKVSKMKYSEFMKRQVFEPLGLKNTFIQNMRLNPKVIANYALGYVMGDKQQIVLPDSLISLSFVKTLDGIVGDGMVKSTITDLRRWDKSLREYRLINKEEFDFIKTLDTLNNGKNNHYSFGWRFNETSMSHSGSWPGYVSYISRDLNSDNLIVILQNFDDVVLPIRPIREILDNKPVSVSYKREIQLEASILKRYVGKYYNSENENSVTTLTLGKNALIFNSTNNPWNMPFYPDSRNTFFSKSPRHDIGFKFIEEDGVVKLIFVQNGKEIGTSIKK
ncbi:serine hydrolase [Riemerella anatipestifer]|uniref:serine hydrolase domain-containing protein n=1 Tax=Riemerella anatipestifer TaxID=34085 RepID=UPI00129DD7A1|nr:serine hydrolase domain-containing protein [Riemerella anatipestifer]